MKVDRDVRWGGDRVVYRAVSCDGQERVAPYGRKIVGQPDGDVDSAHLGGLVRELERGVDDEAGGVEVVPVQVAPSVEGDARGQRCDEELGRCRRSVLAAGVDRFIDRQDVVADSDAEPVTRSVVDPDHRRGVVDLPRGYRDGLAPKPA